MRKVETVTKGSPIFFSYIRSGKKGLLLFLSFLYSVNNFEILNVLNLFTEQRNDNSRSNSFFLSYINFLYGF